MPEEHSTFVYFASDNKKVRQITPTQQGLALFGFLMDRTDKSLLSLEHYLTFKDSDIQYRGIVVPTRGEAERRRVAAHLFGFVESQEAYDKLLWKVVVNDKRYGPGERGLAVTAIGRLKKYDYLRDIRRLTRSRAQRREVRRSAVIALGQLTKGNDEENLAELGHIATKEKDSVMRHFAVMALGQIGGSGAGKRLVNIYNSNARPGNADRQFLCLALGLVGTRDARDTLQIAYEKAGAYEMWPPMMLGLGLSRNPDAVGLTIKRVEGASIVNRDVLAYGSMALGLMGNSKASKTVREVLRKYADSKIREHAAIGLVLLERNKAVPKLLEMLKEGGSLQKKSSAIIALGLLASPSDEVVNELIRAYRNDSNNDAVRAAAIVALGAIADPRKMPLSAKLMRNYNYLIRSGALDLVASLL